MVQLGWKAGTEQFPPTELLEYAIVAEKAGFESLDVSDHFQPGRTYLCVGAGEALNEYAATGMWPEYEERRERLIEAIRLIRAFWSGEEVTFEGNYYQTN